MMTYTLLNTAFFVLLALMVALRRQAFRPRAVVITLALVVTLTAIFDPLMIAAGLVAYDESKLLGLYWFGAPIEDFAYAIFVVPFVAAMWRMFGGGND